MQKINDFWSWFQECHQELYNLHKFDYDLQIYYYLELNAKLEEYNKDIGFIIKFPESEKAELVITADGNPDGVLYVRNLIAAAPRLPNWNFTAFVQPMIDVEKCSQGNDIPYEFDGLTIKASDLKWLPFEHHEATDKWSLMIYIMGYKQLMKDIGPTLLEEYIFIILQDLLGEFIVYKRIERVYYDDLLFNQFELLPIHELPEYLSVESAI
ncbi:hypothetical protein NA63_2932 [Flavobacteriaceae bacterium MAR_2010_105]|nr:hypothetical protein NA63_2932 [Flavobacteriaceae bacterium MAR_2010_105]